MDHLPRTSIELHFEFPFAHMVWNPHYHHAAELDLIVSSELAIAPGESHLMGVDAIKVRRNIETGLLAHIAHRYLVWSEEAEQAAAMLMDRDKGILVPDLSPVIWPIRPTIEAVMLGCALICNDAVTAANDPTARIEYVSLAETVRSKASVAGDQVGTGIEFAVLHLGGFLSRQPDLADLLSGSARSASAS